MALSMGLLRLSHVRPEVTPDASVREAVAVMVEADVGAIAVRTPGARRLRGIFTERDLMRRVIGEGLDPASTPIRDVMTKDVVTVLESTPVAEAAAHMRTHRMRHLVIVDEAGEYLGMLAQRHLLYDLMNDLEMKVDDLTGYVMADGPGG